MHPRHTDSWTWKGLIAQTTRMVAVVWIVTYFMCLSFVRQPELAHLKATAATLAWLAAWGVFILVRRPQTWADLQSAGSVLFSTTGYTAIVPKPEPFPFPALLLECLAVALGQGMVVGLVYLFLSWCASRWRQRFSKGKPDPRQASADQSPTPDGTWT